MTCTIVALMYTLERESIEILKLNALNNADFFECVE